MQDIHIADIIYMEQLLLFERWHRLSDIIHFLDYFFVIKL